MTCWGSDTSDIYCTFPFCLTSPLFVYLFFLYSFLFSLLNRVGDPLPAQDDMFAYGFSSVIFFMSDRRFTIHCEAGYFTQLNQIMFAGLSQTNGARLDGPNATSSLVLKSVMQILTGWPPKPSITNALRVKCAKMLNSTWSQFEVCVFFLSPSLSLSFFLPVFSVNDCHAAYVSG